MTARLSSFVVWALVAASVAVWGLRLAARGQAVPAQAVVTATTGLPVLGDLSRLLGAVAAEALPQADAAAPAPAWAARLKLLGIVAPRGGGAAGGLALVSIDGKPPQVLRVGAELEPGLRLQALEWRVARFGGEGQAGFTLELPPLPEAARGVPGPSTGMPALAQTGFPGGVTAGALGPGPVGGGAPGAVPGANAARPIGAAVPQAMTRQDAVADTPDGPPPTLPPTAR
ncbi:MAG: hypothetical protein RLY78_3822 [Pseudomonadota bacterium]|jgi:general secretion pathway protein C|uniref:Type II secretion system protein N n=1 Tax=Pseudaquabacterium rugosum TaxID=2984194 RepID=A0ABU9B472_9BURK